MIKQSLLNRSMNKSLKYPSCDGVCCDIYKLHGLIIYEIDDIMNAMYITKLDYYYNYDKTEYNKCYLLKKYNAMNGIKCNIINDKK